MRELSKMSPFELGESNCEEAVRYLILYLSKGTANEKRLAASAVNKLSTNFATACCNAVPFLIENLSDSHPQVRQYTLKALAKLRLSIEDMMLIKQISESDSAEYNRRAAREMLSREQELTYNKSQLASNERAFDIAVERDSFLEKYDKVDISGSEKKFLAVLNRECGIELTEKQKAAVLHKEGPALVLAVPGAGKTTVLLSRTANLVINNGINPANILPITFSRASAIDMRNRYNNIFSNITSIGANFSTIHSFAYELIRKYSQLNNLAYTVIEDSENGVGKRALLKKCYHKHNGESLDEDALDELINSIGYVKNMMLSEEQVAEYASEQGLNKFLEIFNDYEEIKRQNSYIDYDDMLTLCYNILRSDANILSRYRNLYKYIQIDEGQDTSKIQHRIIQLIASPSNNLFIVADDDQSIYGFRGAYPGFLIEFERLFPETKKFYIEENFRCTKEIAGLANKFIKANKVRFNKELFTNNENGSPVKLIRLKDEQEQMEFLADELKAAARGCDCAILYRNNMSAIVLGDELSRRGIPFFIRDYNKFFFRHIVTEDIRAFIGLITDNSNIDCLSRIYYRINSFLSKDTILALREMQKKGRSVFSTSAQNGLSDSQRANLMRLERFVVNLKKASPRSVINTFENELGYNKFLRENAKTLGYSYETLRAVLTNLKSLAGKCSSMGEFLGRLEELEKIMENSKFKRENIKVTLSTIHSSKGLEFSKVFIIDLLENVIPTRGSIEKYDAGLPDALEEERRLMYVAMTRARSELSLLLLSSKNDDTVIQSRFVSEIMKL